MPDAVPRKSHPAEDPFQRPLKVAWFSYFPIEWLPDLPRELHGLAHMHPATWQRVLWEQFKNDPRLDLDVIVLRSVFRETHRFTRDRTRFHCLRTPPGLRAASLYWLDTWMIARELRRIKPDLVHAWGSEFGAAAIASRLNYPALVTMQGILTWYGSVFPLNRHMMLSRFLETRSLRQSRVVTCESSFGMGYLAERYPHLQLRQVEHAPSPHFAAVRRHPMRKPIRIVCVGSFLYWKGADIVLKALNRLKDVDFEVLWIGAKNTELENMLRAETEPALWSKLRFRHNLAPREIAEELSRATLFVHAARADNSPNSVKEAVVAGVPVIATNTGGIPDYVIPDKNGFLFESGDVAGCGEQIERALAHPLFREGLVDTGTLEKMRHYLSAETMAAKFYESYLATLRVF